MPATVNPTTPPAPKSNGIAPDIRSIDPNGDVVLVLTRYVQFEDAEDGIDQVDEGSNDAAKAPEPVAKPLSSLNKTWDDGNTSKECEKGNRAAGTPRSMGTTSADVICISDEPPCSEEVIIRVSSRHLTLASPVFHAMLSRKFSESNALRMTGSVEIPLPDDDPDAFLIVLNILHGQIRKVPLVVELETLTQISILVDKYDILEPVELLSNFWFDNLKSTIPESYTDDIPSWICICWIFNKPAEFERTTRLAMRQGRGEIDVAGLPLSPSVVDVINRQRADALGKIVMTLHEHLNDYMENEHCSFECDALMLGSLTKRLRTLKILPHCPNPPYNGLCFEDFSHRFRQGMYFPGAQRTSTFYYSHSKCAIRSIDKMLAKCDERLRGLRLEDCQLSS